MPLCPHGIAVAAELTGKQVSTQGPRSHAEFGHVTGRLSPPLACKHLVLARGSHFYPEDICTKAESGYLSPGESCGS